jgi:Domain of unknown function (DUF4288)
MNSCRPVNSNVGFLLSAMAFIPKDAKWYLAWLVEVITVEDDPRNIVHTNLMLIRADSPDEAYERALELGNQLEMSHENPDGKLVVCAFRGIRDMNVIHDELEHGAELNYEEKVGVLNDDIERMLTPRDQLTIFRPDDNSSKPKYIAKDIADELERRFGTEHSF